MEIPAAILASSEELAREADQKLCFGANKCSGEALSFSTRSKIPLLHLETMQAVGISKEDPTMISTQPRKLRFSLRLRQRQRQIHWVVGGIVRGNPNIREVPPCHHKCFTQETLFALWVGDSLPSPRGTRWSGVRKLLLLPQ